MDSQMLLISGKFLGVEWSTWKVIGWLGNCVFFSRFLVQWYATEKQKRVVIPVAFWWLSLTGSLLLLSYALFYRRDSVFIFANLFSWIPYIRNLIIHHRGLDMMQECAGCKNSALPQARYCSHCGAALAGQVRA